MKRLRWVKGQYDKGELVGVEKKKRASALKHPVKYGRATIKLTDEGLEQFTVAEWLRAHRINFFHVPNEARRHGLEKLALHALGAVPGVADLIILDPPPNLPQCCGTALEMKSRKGKATSAQIAWLVEAHKRGWYAVICRGADEAIKVLEMAGYGQRRTG